MKKKVYYKYMGTNGTLVSSIHLEDVYYIRQIKLFADEGKVLTKDNKNFYEVVTVSDEEVNEWYEVEKK